MQPLERREESDSEDDPDYVPPAEDSAPSSDDERAAKRRRSSPPPVTQEDKAEKERVRDALWSEFQASLNDPTTSSRNDQPKKMVKIERRFRFAGEDVVEVKEVPEDSDEAAKWPRWHPPTDDSQQSTPSAAQDEGAQAASSSSIVQGPEASSKPVKRRGPRKPKVALAPLPGAQKPKKLTTLDKSAMDWRAHVETEQQASGLKDELEAHRRGGGYLEKVEFLKRVESRKEEALEASAANKRRRG